MIVQLKQIWRPENIICNMASASLIGQPIFDLFSATWWTVKVAERSSFRAIVPKKMVENRPRVVKLLRSPAIIPPPRSPIRMPLIDWWIKFLEPKISAIKMIYQLELSTIFGTKNLAPLITCSEHKATLFVNEMLGIYRKIKFRTFEFPSLASQISDRLHFSQTYCR